jgi:glutathione synthase/RimK-type ligase-like ATP-grasp enzyme
MRRIAYLTSPTYRGRTFAAGVVHELEQPNLDRISEAGQERGFEFDVVFWDHPDLTTLGYDAAIIRSCWDYHQRPEQFVSTLEACETAGLPVFNASSVVKWNARKTYLRELGPTAIETIWADRADAATVAAAFDALDADEIIVKPQVGAGSIDTVRLARKSWNEADLAGAPRGAAMIQPFLPAIETEGERSLFWFGGVFSHAIRKVPNAGEWRANLPGLTRFFAEAPPPAALQAAEAARAHAPDELLYVRIDLVLGNDGAWRVIEIEAIEPHLFLDLAPEGGRAFVGAIARVLG